MAEAPRFYRVADEGAEDDANTEREATHDFEVKRIEQSHFNDPLD